VERKWSKFLWLITLGGLLGAGIATWLAPKSIAWYFAPPVEFGVNCKPAVEWALQKMRIAQGLGLLIGALFGLMFFIILWKRQNGRAVPVQQQPA
jgi:hypothetical protein